MSKEMTVETVCHAIRSGAVDHNEGLGLIRGLIDRAINGLSTLSPESEWISVEERMPTKEDADKHGRVFVYEPVLEDMKMVTYLSVNVKIGDKYQYPKWQPLPSAPEK